MNLPASIKMSSEGRLVHIEQTQNNSVQKLICLLSFVYHEKTSLLKVNLIKNKVFKVKAIQGGLLELSNKTHNDFLFQTLSSNFNL